jgi:hypothetical protein
MAALKYGDEPSGSVPTELINRHFQRSNRIR